MKILIIRNDGLGDFIHTLPLISAIKKQLSAEIYVLVHKRLNTLIPLCKDIDGAIYDEGILLKRDRKKNPSLVKKKRRELLLEIKSHQFTHALFAYSEFYSSYLIYQAKIPIRIGPIRRWYFFLFNEYYYLSKKKSSSKEYELILKMGEPLGISPQFTPIRLFLPPVSLPYKIRKPYILIHPYKRNPTSLSYPPRKFKSLIKKIQKEFPQLHFYFIGDWEDKKALKSFQKYGEVLIGLSFPQLIYLMKNAELFIGNSSGPLQLASLVGTPHIGLYPQAKILSPTRWGTIPQTPTYKKRLLSPSFPIECHSCLLEKCPYYNCVEKIPPKEILKAIYELTSYS